jgi:hypothetical protein
MNNRHVSGSLSLQSGVLENGGLGLLWEGKISYLDFSFPNRNGLMKHNMSRFFKEIEQ